MRRGVLLAVALIVLSSPGTLAGASLPAGSSAPASAAAAPSPGTTADAPPALELDADTPPPATGRRERRHGPSVSAPAPNSGSQSTSSPSSAPVDPLGSGSPLIPSRSSVTSDPPGVTAVDQRSHTDVLRVVGAVDVHRANVTGRNVTVGVIDAGFRSSYPAVADRVGAYREFDTPGGWRHGTAVAGVVASVAPDANLHLAAVGARVSPEEYRAAVEWLLASGADVVVDAGSYHTQPGNGSGPISRSAARAAEQAVFVTSVGNHADSYWRGTIGGGEWVTFGEKGVEGNPMSGSAGPIRATLRWQSPAVDYGLYLFRERPGRDALVASARGDDRRYATVAAAVPPGDYYLAIRVRDRPDGENVTANATTSTLELIANRDLRYSSRARPSAPALAPGVLAVGAVRHGEVRSYSVPGADIAAPDRPTVDTGVRGGTSIAAPYVAGAAALTVAANPAIDPAAVRERLLAGARDLGPDGVDPRTGYGLVDAEAAIRPPATYPPRIWPVDLDGRIATGYTMTWGKHVLGPAPASPPRTAEPPGRSAESESG